jgi:hypothetical protein
MASLPKTCPDYSGAFQRTASRFIAFFLAYPLNQASLFRVCATKKPVTFVTSFVNWLGLTS